ncbi:efflux RND transporter periplasmic adaptor subunit [Shewanella avicenniae]|uniref:Efflux RND transporter periplasmic adaptor subunit n=1 Tax=Shewanella avicenniae TaxID=2814294 RepID=A0ABX7QUM2_9GAMM|nr:efflux RND transporter periplasmic adaptor subunit [Shewanella avicenniae]QSX35193.1 efflux RND transporter periplasmic adaptor subunit [Shewanella avicenniae]
MPTALTRQYLPAGLAAISLLFSTISLAAAPAKRVVVQPVTFEHEITRVDVVGTAEADKSVVLYPAVAERVVEVNFKPGDKVVEGQALVKLYAQRQQVAVERAQIQLADAERTVKRLTNIRQQGAVPQTDLDDAITLRDLAKVSLEEAQVALEERIVRAPFSGYVGLTDVEVGDRLSINTPITSIDSRAALYVNFQAPETAFNLLASNAEIVLRPWNNRAELLPATIAQLDSRVDATSRTIRARALIDNRQDHYRPGMSFRVSLQIVGDEYARIPEAALSWGATGAYVWVVENQQAKRVDIQIQQRLKGRILVAGELTSTTPLIIEGIQNLREGQTVTVVEEQF